MAVSGDVLRTEEAARSSAERFRTLASAAPVADEATSNASDGTAAFVVYASGAEWAWALREEGGALARGPMAYANATDAESARASAANAAAQAPEPEDIGFRGRFDPATLDKAVIALPLLKRIEASPANAGHRVTIDLNLLYAGGRDAARKRVLALIEALAATTPPSGAAAPLVLHRSAGATSQYVVARLSGDHVRRLVRYDRDLTIDLAAQPGPPEASGGPAPKDERDPAFETALRQALTRQFVGTARLGAGSSVESPLLGDLPALYEAVKLTGAIYRIWPDFEVHPLLTRSVATIKGDAARVAFSALGAGIVWAVVDSGVDGTHPHFQTHDTLGLPKPLYHRDFTEAGTGGALPEPDPTALEDPFGHGTHVAGIVAGEHVPNEYRARREAEFRDNAEARAATVAPGKKVPLETEAGAAQEEPVAPEATGGDAEAVSLPAAAPLMQVVRERGEKSDDVQYVAREVEAISGVAPQCKVLSLRVLDRHGKGYTSDIIEALRYVYDLNQGGRFMRVHGVNLSVGYEFDAEWFACGHSPLCQEVDLLVRSGVVVVVAAGNTGYGELKAREGTWKAGHDLSINDPGNAERAITVGSTHPHEPHRYGVSFFSSKGPTGDGRIKPDLVAPGEKVISCAAGLQQQDATRGLRVQRMLADPADPPAPDVAPPSCHYLAQSGTSMAAPHVAGAVAAFLSIRREFIGRSEDVKRLFLDNATDLGRDPYFQGHGLLDLMRTVQAV